MVRSLLVPPVPIILSVVTPRIRPSESTFLLGSLLRLPNNVKLLPDTLATTSSHLPTIMRIRVKIVNKRINRVIRKKILMSRLIRMVTGTMFYNMSTTRNRAAVRGVKRPRMRISNVNHTRTTTGNSRTKRTIPTITLLNSVLSLKRSFLRSMTSPLLVTTSPPMKITINIKPNLLVSNISKSSRSLPKFSPQDRHANRIRILGIRRATVLAKSGRRETTYITMSLTLRLPTRYKTMVLRMLYFRMIPSSVGASRTLHTSLAEENNVPGK